MKLTDHQLKQKEVIDNIADQVSSNSLNFSTVSPTDDYKNDPRICLTGVHFPNQNLISEVKKIVDPLKEIEPDFFYYPKDSLHMTVKNVRVINDPPTFNEEDIDLVRGAFSKVLPYHKKFNVYFYRLLLFPNNLALIGTTDPELDRIILNLDKELKTVGVPDDKTYANSRFFFSNMTLARFSTTPSQEFKEKVLELSDEIKIKPYAVDSVTLVTGNAVFKEKEVIEKWQLS